MGRAIRAVAVTLALLLIGTGVLVRTPSARAAGNQPQWTAGDFWAYSESDGDSFRAEIVGRENVATLLGTVYDAFHFRETTTSGSITVTSDSWVRQEDLGLVKTSITLFGITTNTTYDPPQSHASFPLFAGKNWSVSLQISIKIGNGNPFTVGATYAADVDAELDVTVPAGTFRSQSVRESTAGAYSKFYFSEQVGFWSKEENYDTSDQKTGERVLTSYRYQSGLLGLLLIIGGAIVLAGIVVAAFAYRRRKRAQMPPPGTYPPQPPQAPPGP